MNKIALVDPSAFLLSRARQSVSSRYDRQGKLEGRARPLVADD